MCLEANHRRRVKKTAKAERGEKAKLETEQPGLYHHPSPFNTNPYWQEEIEAGPSPGKKGKKKEGKNGSNDGSKEKLKGDEGKEEKGRLNTATTTKDGDSLAPSSPTAVGGSPRESAEVDGFVDDPKWNCRRYQREDEELWGVNVTYGLDTIKAGHRALQTAFETAQQQAKQAKRSVDGTISGTLKGIESFFPFRGDNGGREERHPYFVSRNPPVNDLHPPIVTTSPWRKDAMKWMLQPPPSANVMAGKERVDRDVNRSRAGSRASTLPGTPMLSRQITSRNIEEKIRRGELPIEMEWQMRKMGSKTTLGAKTASSATLQGGIGLDGSLASLPLSNALTLEAPTTRSGRARGYSGSSVCSSAVSHNRKSPLFSGVANRRLSIDSIEEVPLYVLDTNTTSRPGSRPRSKTTATKRSTLEVHMAHTRKSMQRLGIERTSTQPTSVPRTPSPLRRIRTEPLRLENIEMGEGTGGLMLPAPVKLRGFNCLT